MTSSFQPFTSQAQGAALPIHAPGGFNARIAALWVFPIKSCAGVSVTQALLTPTGLAHDRAWMLVDADGEMLTQRELPRMALIQPEWVHASAASPEQWVRAPGMAALQVPLSHTAPAVTVRVWDDAVPAFDMGPAVGAWFTEFLGSRFGALRLVRFDDTHLRPSSKQWTQGLPSHNQFSDGFPLLVASTASLEELNARLKAKGEASVDMRRFRANVVLGHADSPTAHAEDQPASTLSLHAHDEDRIGTLTIHTQDDAASPVVKLQPVKPCPRCPIPNVDPDSAQSHPAVSDALQAYRQDPRVNGALTFGMNCLPTEGIGQLLRVGQAVGADWAFESV